MTLEEKKDEGYLAGVGIDIFAHPRYWSEKSIGTRSFVRKNSLPCLRAEKHRIR